MLPMRLITPAHASIASLSMVFPEDAWPTIAKLRISPGLYSFIKRSVLNLSAIPFESLRAWAMNLDSDCSFASEYARRIADFQSSRERKVQEFFPNDSLFSRRWRC